MNKSMFENTKWDAREWTDEMKQKWNSKVQELGFAGLHNNTLLKSAYLWLEKMSASYVASDTNPSIHDFLSSGYKEMEYGDMFPEENEAPILAMDDDIFTHMKTIAKENSMFISFDGLNEGDNDVIVVTHISSDTEYVVNNLEEFNQLTQSFKALEKFERKI